MEVIATGVGDSGTNVTIASDTASNDPVIGFLRARGTLAAPTIVSSAAAGDEGGTIFFSGHDGSSYRWATQIQSRIDASPGVNDMPTRLVFATSPDGSTTTASRLTIKASGYIGMASTAPSKHLHVGSASVASATAVANFENADGTCTITPAAAGSGIACSSDERLKENFANVSGDFALDKILKLQAVTYNFKTASVENRRTGYKAQNVQAVAPEFVRKDDNGYLQVYYDAFIPWITEAIKMIHTRLQKVEDQQIVQARQIASKADQSEVVVLKNNNQVTFQKIHALEDEDKEINARLEKIENSLRH